MTTARVLTRSPLDNCKHTEDTAHHMEERHPNWAFNSSAAELRISSESFLLFTARAIERAPTSVDNAAIALFLLDLGPTPGISFVSSSRYLPTCRV